MTGVRWHLACDACEAEAWIGPDATGLDAWCESCQRPARVAPGAGARCGTCRAPLATGAPGFEELYGQIQNLAAVLAAWDGVPGPLAELLPERPRFLTDLTPPAPRDDDSEAARAALATLASGAFAAARVRLEDALAAEASPRLWRALGIAAERLGEPMLAEAAYSRGLELAEDETTRLARGVLRARRGDFDAAREDLARAGDRHEARWNRAALAVVEAVATTPGLASPETLRGAREEASGTRGSSGTRASSRTRASSASQATRAADASGRSSPFWSDPTVGRLLWSLLIERAGSAVASRSLARARPPDDPDARMLRAAEHELEFETFWDRAMVVHGYARLGMEREAAAAAAPLAQASIRKLLESPAVRGATGEIHETLASAARAIAEGRPGVAHAGLARLLAREDLRRYRIPCARCGRGSVGVDQVEDDGAAE